MTELLLDAVSQVRKLPTGLGGTGVGAIERGVRRREFVALLCAAAAGLPKALRAEGNIARIGVLWHAGSEEEEAVFLIPFRQELKDLGCPEGRIVLENRFPGERYERFQGYASELVSARRGRQGMG